MSSRPHASGRARALPPGTGRRRGGSPLLGGVIRFVGRVVRGVVAAAVLVALVAGLPWALWHYLGWPLPDHLPSWAEIEAVLLFGPMTSVFLLDVLACASWIVWAVFVVDVLRCTGDVVRGGLSAATGARWPGFSETGPLHALAGILIGGILLSVLGQRPTPAPAAAVSAAPDPGTRVVATAAAWQPRAPGVAMAVVRAPQDGVHDSLSRIAQRTLGDAARWPEIFRLNQGKPQPHGHTFTNPHLIFPYEELALPADATTPPRRAAPSPNQPVPTPTPPPSSTPSPTTTAPPASMQPSTPAPAPAAPAARPPAVTGPQTPPPGMREPGFRSGPELFVGLGLAAAVSAALLVARRRHRARYLPGSGDRNDLPLAPIVYQLRLAHLHAETHDSDLDDEDDHDDEGDSADREAEDADPPRPMAPPAALVVDAPAAGRRPGHALGLGVQDGREITVDLTTTRGLGLVGPGSPAAVRALLVAALTTDAEHPGPPAGASVVVPAEDLAAVLGPRTAQTPLPSSLRVVTDLQEALDTLEADILVRAGDPDRQSWPPLVLVARPPQQYQRLQAVLDNGAPFGITGLLLGQWRPGVTCYIRGDGTLSATGPGLDETLRGTHTFRLGDDDTAELLTVLRQAEPDPPPDDSPGDRNGVGTPPTTRPLRVPTRPDDTEAPGDGAGRSLDSADRGQPGPGLDAELEVTTAAPPPVSADGELEALTPSGPTTPGAPLRAPATAPPRSAASGDPEPGEHASAAHREHTSTAAPPTPASDSADTEPDTAQTLVTVTVLGALQVYWHPETSPEREITGALQPRTKELLVLLALHPGGTTRDTLIATLWADNPPARPTNALHTALSRLRRDLAEATDAAVTDLVTVDNGRYRLDPATVAVDYWRFENAVTARRTATTDAERIAASREVINSYGGPLADGISTLEWIEPAREAIRRDALDAVSGLARALVRHDPQQTLDLLEIARAFDPHNELLYRDIMRLQAKLGLLDAIPRTLTLLTTRLAELGEQPTPQARALAARLSQHPHHNPPDRDTDPTALAAKGERGHGAAS